MDNNRDLLLYVDDEEQALKYFNLVFSKDYEVLTATSVDQAWKLIEQHVDRLALVISDQRMPGRSGVDLLTALKERCPHVVRLLTTAYSDLGSAIAAVNTGAIYAYISKPWKIDDLRVVIRQALQYHHLLLERNDLMAEKLSVFQDILLLDVTRGMGLALAGLNGQIRRPLAAATAWLQHRREVFKLGDLTVAEDARDLWPHVLKQTRSIITLSTNLSKWLEQHRGSVQNIDLAEALLQGTAGSAVSKKISESSTLRMSIEPQLLNAGCGELFALIKTLLPSETVANVKIGSAQGKPLLDLTIHGNAEQIDSDQLLALDHQGLAGYLAIYHHGGIIAVPSWNDADRRMEITFQDAQDDGVEKFLALIANAEL